MRSLTLQSWQGWVGVEPNLSVIANRAAVGASERLTLTDLNGGELQDGDQVNLQGPNGRYFAAEGGGGGAVNADRAAPSTWERFTVSLQANGSISLRSLNGQFLVSEAGTGQLLANRQVAGLWETFRPVFE